MGVAQVGHQVPDLLEEVALAPLDPEQLGQLPGHDGQGQPDDEPLEHRLGDEAGQEPQAQQPGEHGRDPGGDGQGHGQLDERPLPWVASWATAAADRAAVADIGPTTRCRERRRRRRAPAPPGPRTAPPPATPRRWRHRPAPRAPAPPTPSARRPHRRAASFADSRGATEHRPAHPVEMRVALLATAGTSVPMASPMTRLMTAVATLVSSSASVVNGAAPPPRSAGTRSRRRTARAAGWRAAAGASARWRPGRRGRPGRPAGPCWRFRGCPPRWGRAPGRRTVPWRTAPRPPPPARPPPPWPGRRSTAGRR